MNFDSPLPNGVYTAGLTPMKEDLSVDYDTLIAHCHILLNSGSDGLALLGTTGEANSFTVKERFEFISVIAESDLPANRIMVGTGCCAYNDTIALTKHAVRSGFGGILMLPPFYYKQVDDRGLAKYFDLVINGVNDDRLRIFLYHIPKMSGIYFSPTLVERLIAEYPGVVVGMKDSSGDWEHMQFVLKSIPGFKLFAGTERLLLPTLRAGGAGCISATANVTIGLAAEVLRNWQSANADFLQEHLTKVRTTFEAHPFVPILKQILAKIRNNPTWLNMRPPNAPVDEDAVKIVQTSLEALDFERTP